jgi:metal-responsive CopG/Arc/MetJ family transcriptional regulator
MKRTLVGLSDQDFQALDTLSDAKHVSRAELIRQAISQYLEKFKSDSPSDLAFGLWSDKQTDGLVYQQKMRDEW